MALSTAKDHAVVFGSLYQAQEVLIMLLRGMAEYAYIIMYGHNTK